MIGSGDGYHIPRDEIQKTPEMNELEADNFPLKIWAHNFAKQKNASTFKKRVFFWKIDVFFDGSRLSRIITVVRRTTRPKKEAQNLRNFPAF